MMNKKLEYVTLSAISRVLFPRNSLPRTIGEVGMCFRLRYRCAQTDGVESQGTLPSLRAQWNVMKRSREGHRIVFDSRMLSVEGRLKLTIINKFELNSC